MPPRGMGKWEWMGTIGKGGYRVVYSCHRSSRVTIALLFLSNFPYCVLSLTPSIDQGW